MSGLHERFPPLAGTLPRLPLVDGPTPVRRLAALEQAAGLPETWLKDDGRSARPWGGNKPRKLEWVLADLVARGRRTVVTAGGLGTHHGLATALYARRHGLACTLLLVDQPDDEHVRAQLRRIEASGAEVVRTRTTARTALALPWVLATRPRAAWLPVGGSSPLGCVGFVEAALELGAQVDGGALPEPSHVVVALGSGGTAAGLLVGLRLAGLRTRVVAVQVNDRMPLSPRRIAGLARRTARLLRRRGARLPPLAVRPEDLDVVTGWLGAGYGHPTPEGRRAADLARDAEGLALEPVYTAKALAALVALGGSARLGAGPLLFWQTHHAGERVVA